MLLDMEILIFMNIFTCDTYFSFIFFFSVGNNKNRVISDWSSNFAQIIKEHKGFKSFLAKAEVFCHFSEEDYHISFTQSLITIS